MKQLRFILSLGLFAVMPLSVIHAIDLNIESPHVMAETMPDSTELFIASRVGTDWITELDAVLVALYDKLPDNLDIERQTIDSVFRDGFNKNGLDWDLFLGLLGDYAAIGLEPMTTFNDDEEPFATVVIEITDQKAVEVLFDVMTAESGDDVTRSMEGDVIRYDNVGKDHATVYITSTHIIATTNPSYSLNPSSPLSASSDFTDALSLLNEDHYNVLAYASKATVEAALSDGDTEGLQAFGLSPQDASPLVAGFTFQDDNTFTTDIAMGSTATAPNSTVSISYLNAMPASTDAFIVASDFTNLYNNIITTAQEIAKAEGSRDNPETMIPLMFRLTGLDLEEDVFSWTTGGYGIFLGADVMSIVNEVVTTDNLSELNIEAGLVIEATDIDLARNTAAELGKFLALASGDNDEVTVTQTELNGLPATLVSLDVPAKRDNPPFAIELVLTVTDDFLFFGTRSAFDSIVSGDTLADNADFISTVPQLLDNPTSVWYTNADGLLIPTIFGLNNDGGRTGLNDPTQILDVLESFDDILTSMTFSTAIDDAGVIRLRGTMSLNP